MFTGLQQCSELHEGLLAQVTKSGGTETLTYLHTDHLATPRYGTNAAGATVWTWDSGAFGKEAPTGTATINLRFPGQYYDSETTLHYNWNRYYNPATGRYISSDPIGLVAGLATYNYGRINPLLFVDPEGLTVQQIEDMRKLAEKLEDDLAVPSVVYVKDLGITFGGKIIAGYTNPFTYTVTVDDKYLPNLNCKELHELYQTIVHESLHRTYFILGFFGSVIYPGAHDAIKYKDAPARKYLASPQIRRRCACYFDPNFFHNL
jgi:RHS repeat-associated protein